MLKGGSHRLKRKQLIKKIVDKYDTTGNKLKVADIQVLKMFYH